MQGSEFPDPRFEIGRRLEDVELASAFLPVEQTQFRQSEQIRTGSGVDHGVTGHMGPRRVLPVRVPNGVSEECELAVVQVRPVAEQPVDPCRLRRL